MVKAYKTATNWLSEGYENFGAGIYRNYSLDSPDFPSNAVYDALNMVYDLDGDDLEKMLGGTILTTISGTPTITGFFDYADGTELVITADDGKIYKRTTGSASQITNGTGFDTNAGTRWSGGMGFGQTSSANLLVLSNGIDAPQRYNGTNIAALAGSPPSTGQFFLSWLGHYWFFDIQSAYYSVGDDCEDWTGPGAGNIGIFLGEGGNITGAKVFAGSLFIFKKNFTYRIAPVTNISDIVVDRVSPNIGVVSHHTLADSGPEGAQTLYFLSDFGLEACYPVDTSGNVVIRNVSQPVAIPLSKRSRGYQDLAWSLSYTRRKEYHCYYPTYTQTVPSAVLIANIARGRNQERFTRSDHANLTAGIAYRSSGDAIFIAGDTSGNIWQLATGHIRDTAPYRGMVSTRAYTQGEVSSVKLYNRYYVSTRVAGSYPVSVNPLLGRYKMTPVPSGQTTAFVNPSSDGWGVGTWGNTAYWGGGSITGEWTHLKKARRGTYIRFHIYTLGANQWFKLAGIEFESKPASRITKTRS